MAVRTSHHNKCGYRLSQPRTAFTLVEAVLSVLVVGLMLVAVLNTAGGITKARTVQAKQDEAAVLGWDLLWEVAQARYEDPQAPGGWGSEAGETGAGRSSFDDTDDYDGWTASPPQKKDGTVMNQYAGWRRSVSVTLIEPASLARIGSPDLGLREVHVTVVDPQGNTRDFYVLRSSQGSGEKTPGHDTDSVTWARVTVRSGAGGSTSSVNLINTPAAE